MKIGLCVMEVAFVQGCFLSMFHLAPCLKLLHSLLSTAPALMHARMAVTQSESQ